LHRPLRIAYQVTQSSSSENQELNEVQSSAVDVNIWIDADDITLASIERVTYYLHPSFTPSVLSIYEKNFSLNLVAWGEFQLNAKVYFKDGRIADLSKFVSVPHQ
jgi:transcription initiation factor IIF auxiliary subunit